MGQRIGGFLAGVAVGVAALLGPVAIVIAVVLLASARRVLGVAGVPWLLAGAGATITAVAGATMLNGDPTAVRAPATPAVLAIGALLLVGGLFLAARGGGDDPGRAAGG